MPAQFTELRLGVPDFIAFVELEGETRPFLIEVKSTEDDTLVWSDKYLSSLRSFVDLLQIPLLVAWKWRFGWVLVDASAFEKKSTAYHLPATKALQENLMCALFGDVTYVLKEDFQMVMDATIEDYEPRPEDKLIPPGTYTFKLEGLSFRVDKRKTSDLPDEFVWFFFSFPQTHVVNRKAGNEVQIVCVPESDTTVCLSDVLMAMLFWKYSPDEGLDWDRIIQEGYLPHGGPHLRSMLKNGIERGFIRCVLQQVPSTKPPYLS
jgi:Holliday junction resolvase